MRNSSDVLTIRAAVQHVSAKLPDASRQLVICPSRPDVTHPVDGPEFVHLAGPNKASCPVVELWPQVGNDPERLRVSAEFS